MICRSLQDRNEAIGRCVSQFGRDKKLIFVLEDEDMFELLSLRQSNNWNGIDTVLHRALDRVMLGNSKG